MNQDSLVTLAIPYHDPDGEQNEQLRQMLPLLTQRFAHIVVNASPETQDAPLAQLAAVGASIAYQDRAVAHEDIVQIGKIRRDLLAQALQTPSPYILYCDGDRVLHWAKHYPDELAAVVARVPDYDFTIFGRTPRAFESHPRIQTETERIINEVYARISGHEWDITAAARGLSCNAAQAIVDGSQDDTFGVDASWPLLIQQTGGFTMTEVKTAGLEFETAGKLQQTVAAAGGEDVWKAQVDNDPQRWIRRLALAQIEVESMLPYANLTS